MRILTRRRLVLVALLLGGAVTPVCAAEEWEVILRQALQSERSQTRHDGLKQVDTTTAKGLRTLWKVLANRDPRLLDWYVREGAYEALLKAEGEQAEKEIEKVLKGSGNEMAKEAIVYAVIWKVRKEVVKAYGGNDDRKIEMAKYFLRKKRGVRYFEYVLPVIRKFDPKQKYLGRIQKALADKSTRVRRAALTGLVTYPDNTSIPLLLQHLKKLEKKKTKYYREWVLTRYALETLTGQYYRDSVSDWLQWWEIAKDQFSIAKRIKEETGEGKSSGKTVVVQRGGVQVTVHMKVAGAPDGYPLLVIPWRGYEVDYFRPYFHGVEEFCRTFYVRMPQIGDYKGLARHGGSNLVQYPTSLLSGALADLMKDTGLDKFGLLAHGPDAGVLAMMLAAENQDHVTHLVLINPSASGSAYSGAIASVRRYGVKVGNQEIVKGADSIQLGPNNKPLYVAADPAEGGGISRAIRNLRYADPTEPEVGTLSYLYRLAGGVQVLNDRRWSVKNILGSDKFPTKTLIFMGLKSPWSPQNDMAAVAASFARPIVAKVPGTAEFPFMSQTYMFTRYMERLFRDVTKSKKKSR